MPDIAFDKDRAFYPFVEDENGLVRPSYTSRICLKKALGKCWKWGIKRTFPALKWFELNDFGACKRPRPASL